MPLLTEQPAPEESDRSGLRLGVEIECFLTDRHAPAETIGMRAAEFADRVVARFNERVDRKICRPMKTDNSVIWDREVNQQWSLTTDYSLRGETETMYALEVVSPILQVNATNAWRHEITHMFITLQADFTLTTNRSCGLHIHLSPSTLPTTPLARGDWTLSEAIRIAQAVVFFERALEALLPPTRRRTNRYHRSNHAHNRHLAHLSPTTDALREIETATSFWWLADTLQPDANKRFNWNFLHLTPTWAPDPVTGVPTVVPSKGTVEFRQPPGITSAAECLAWVELAMCFVQAARRGGVARFAPTVEGLRAFCGEGAGALPPGVLGGCLEGLFAGREGALEPLPVEAGSSCYDDLVVLGSNELNFRRGVMAGPEAVLATPALGAGEEGSDSCGERDDGMPFSPLDSLFSPRVVSAGSWGDGQLSGLRPRLDDGLVQAPLTPLVAAF